MHLQSVNWPIFLLVLVCFTLICRSLLYILETIHLFDMAEQLFFIFYFLPNSLETKISVIGSEV